MFRVHIAAIGLMTLFFLCIARLFYFQVILGDQYRRQANAQHSYSLPLPANRGTILSCDGSPLVLNADAYLVYAQPKIISNPQLVATSLSQILAQDTAQITDILMSRDLYWVPVAHKVDGGTVENIRALNITGIGFESDSKRLYPEASMAAHILGFVGSDEKGGDRGYFGLEGFYDRDLRGKPGMLNQEKDARGNPIAVSDIARIRPVNGRTLTLWLDRVVQRITDTKLAEGIEKYGAKEGSVTVMDPHTGGILAMSTYPSYDPARYTDFGQDLYKNPIISGSYEPGSTFKVLVMAAGLDQNVIKPDTVMNENGPVQIGQYSIKTWNNTYNGSVSMTDVLIHSSNVGMVFVQKELGGQQLLSAISRFGFGKPTGIDLEEESSPVLRDKKDWTEIDYATASFGQGIAVTPLQMIRAVASIANGGMLPVPRIVKVITDDDGKTSSVGAKQERRVISAKTADMITDMMVAAVDQGEAKWAKPKGYRIAGKTGTAQIPVAGHYDEKKTIASFVGFAPADNPKFIILVTLREPSSSQWGSETAAPLFFSIARELFMYYGIAPGGV